MAERKFYWLKLKRDFFKRHDVRIIEEMPNGKDYILFYLKMLLESIDHEGELRFSEAIPYNEQMLSVITNTNIDIVKSAMKIFIDLNMIEILDDSTIYMAEVQRLIGSETAAAARMRKSRESQKALPKCNNVTDERNNVQNCYIEIEKEIELEKEKEKEDNKPVRHKYGEYKNMLLTDEDMDKLKKEFPSDYAERIERLSCYIASSGKSYKNHLATIRNWARKENPPNNQAKSKYSYVPDDGSDLPF